MRLFKRKVHHAAVYDTRPIPGDSNQFDPYFIALCDCGWVGLDRRTSDEAFQDAGAHTADVDLEIKRPLG